MKRTLLKNKITTFGVLVFALGVFNVSHAQYTWTGATSTDFMNAANWSTAPTFINTDAFTIGAGTNVATLGAAGYTKTSGAPTSGIIVVTTAGTLITSGSINPNGLSSMDGQQTINGGIFNVRNNYYIGSTAGTSVAIANVETGGTLNAKSTLIVSQKQPGILNVNGGTISTDATGSIAIGNYKVSYVNCSGILNINSGTVKVFKTGGLIIGSAGIVNIDAGKIELTGDQTAAIAAYISAGTIKVSGAAATAGKTISNTYDSVSGLTTVITTGGLGVNNSSLAKSISIYPNPTSDVIYIAANTSLSEKLIVSLYSISGQKVLEKEFLSAANTNSIDIKGKLIPGVYLVKLSVGSSNSSSKIIIK